MAGTWGKPWFLGVLESWDDVGSSHCGFECSWDNKECLKNVIWSTSGIIQDRHDCWRAISSYSSARKVCMTTRRLFHFWFGSMNDVRYAGISPFVIPRTRCGVCLT